MHASDPAGLSHWADLGGPFHYVDHGGPPDGPVVVAVHGLGGSALNWLAMAPLLTGSCRVIAPDLAGHGLTPAGGRSTAVGANRRLLHRFVDTAAGGPVILMGNSMGGMISLLEAAAHPEAVAGLVLLDPAAAFVPALPDPRVAALFAAYATPLLSRVAVARHRALPAETTVGAMLTMCCADPSRVPPEVVAAHVDQVRHRAGSVNAERDLRRAARSVVLTAGSPCYRRAIRAVRAPALLIHGERDRLVPAAASRALARTHPAWELVILPGVGHVPQLEASRETAEEILRWLSSDAAAGAVRAARHPLAPGRTATR